MAWAALSYFYAINPTETLVTGARLVTTYLVFIVLSILFYKQPLPALLTGISVIMAFVLLYDSLVLLKTFSSNLTTMSLDENIIALRGNHGNKNVMAAALLIKFPFVLWLIINNKLPNCYNALTYFRKSKLAEQFFMIVKDIFENWDQYKLILKCKSTEEVSTDWAYSIACHILGKDKTTMPMYDQFAMVHMKQKVNDLFTEDWTKELVCEFTENGFRINTFLQTHPFHYHIKDFSKEVKKNVR
jgi:hypothetical protein